MMGLSFEEEIPQDNIDSTTIDLNALTVTELRNIAKDKGITGYSSMTKAQLIEALTQTP